MAPAGPGAPGADVVSGMQQRPVANRLHRCTMETDMDASAQPSPSDAELVRRTLGGEREAFGELVRRHERVVGLLALQRVGCRALAEDVVQDSFLKAFVRLETLSDPSRFAPWLYGIAFRASVDALRRRQRETRRRAHSIDAVGEAGGPAEPATAQPSGFEAAWRGERDRLLLEALGRLEDPYRLVLTLRYYRHMRYREIAQHLGEPPGTVANRLHRAVAKLRALLAPRLEGRPER
ncbi:MAG: sigma-70 family RNA polymerase sigma factor [Planctomycetota bacterium]|nr:MAG: sigma-70 family RNA polymerase sigma factor [Planctomycetota bacterium]